MGSVPLQLALDPVLPTRAPDRGEATIGYGFRLRLPDGPALALGDPLLELFGAAVCDVRSVRHAESAQHEHFEPGRRLQLLPEAFDVDDREAVGVWDHEGLRQAGVLPARVASRACAALDHGVPIEGVTLWEERSAIDDTRDGLTIVVLSPALVSIELPDGLEVPRPRARSQPRRLVLFADGSPDVRWWDPAAVGGPVDLDELPLSPDLADELEQLREGYAALGEEDAVEQMWDREGLDASAVKLWRRVRVELGRRYRVGFLGPGMRRPAWAPSDLADDDGDDEEFEGMFEDASL